jgi:FAD synthetase
MRRLFPPLSALSHRYHDRSRFSSVIANLNNQLPRRHLGLRVNAVQHLRRVAQKSKTNMAVIDRHTTSAEVFDLAESGEPIAERVKEALRVIEDALDTYTCALFCILHRPSSPMLFLADRRGYPSVLMEGRIVREASFFLTRAPSTPSTGTVLLHLYAAALAHRSPPSTKPIPAVYIPVPSPFTELEVFIQESAKLYDLDLFTCTSPSNVPLPVESVTPGTITPITLKQNGDYVGTPALTRPVGKARGGEGMRRALQMYKDICPQIEAVLIGTRRSDPHGGKFLHCLQE